MMLWQSASYTQRQSLRGRFVPNCPFGTDEHKAIPGNRRM